MFVGSIDLHAHTTVSDGNLTPAELVSEAVSRGLSALAVTDHDRLEAIEPAREAARGKEIEIVPGVEISTSHGGFTLHLLGLLVDPHHAGLRAFLQTLFEARHRRIEKIAEKLTAANIPITAQEILAEAAGGSPGRNHVAKVLLKKGVVNARKEAFERFLAKDKPGFVPYEKCEPPEAIAMIREAGGRSFLAHPGLVRNQELIHQVIDWGIDGLEVIHPEHGPEQVRRYTAICADKKLLRSGGSDYHGPGMDRKGDLGKMNVPREFLEAMRQK